MASAHFPEHLVSRGHYHNHLRLLTRAKESQTESDFRRLTMTTILGINAWLLMAMVVVGPVVSVCVLVSSADFTRCRGSIADSLITFSLPCVRMFVGVQVGVSLLAVRAIFASGSRPLCLGPSPDLTSLRLPDEASLLKSSYPYFV